MNLKYLISLLLLTSVVSLINGDCPEKCKCDKKPENETILVVDCSYKNITEITELPLLVGTSFTEIELNIQWNNFTALPNSTNILLGYEKVTLINASSNGIDQTFLRNIPEFLKVLDVTHNNISAITTDIQEVLIKNGVKTYITGNPWTRFCSSVIFLKTIQEVEKIDQTSVECKPEHLVEKDTLANNKHVCYIIILSMLCSFILCLGASIIYQFCRKISDQY